VALFLLCATAAERPLLSGLLVGLGLMTRAPLAFMSFFFILEALRTSCREPSSASDLTSLRRLVERVDFRRFVGRCAWFVLPLLCCLAIVLWHNQVRFGDPFEFGYQHLTVAWQARMKKWGLFHYHYLGRNLGVVLTNLPYVTPRAEMPFQINAHGLALWVTTPLYLWLLWPRSASASIKQLRVNLWLTVAAVALPTLFYQNTGWTQFGYRFSNDYAVLLFVLLALGRYRFGKLFKLAALWSIVINAFGAMSFNRASFQDYYFVDRTQRTLHQPD
jgi:hypothetical protein